VKSVGWLVTVWAGKLTGIWTVCGGKPGPKALAGIVTRVEPEGIFTVCAGIYIWEAPKRKLGRSSWRAMPAWILAWGQ